MKFNSEEAMTAQRGSRRIALTLTSALDGDGQSTARPGRFTPGKDTVPIIQRAGWAAGLVWTGAVHPVLTGIRSPELSTRSETPL